MLAGFVRARQRRWLELVVLALAGSVWDKASCWLELLALVLSGRVWEKNCCWLALEMPVLAGFVRAVPAVAASAGGTKHHCLELAAPVLPGGHCMSPPWLANGVGQLHKHSTLPEASAGEANLPLKSSCFKAARAYVPIMLRITS